MSSKVKRKVTVESTKESDDQPRRPSVFERLGPGTVSITTSQSQERHSRSEPNEKCRNWLRTGNCVYGSACRYEHDPFPNSSRRSSKQEKDADEKDLRHKVRTKRDDTKESRTGSISPKRKGNKRSGSRSRKGEHESKIKSTVVVTRPRTSPNLNNDHPPPEAKKKADGTWEIDSDDWPIDEAQLDYKEELTLELKRQQLQRELELELQKEQMMNEDVTITKTVAFSESSSSSSSSDSGSISSSSGTSSSSSDDDSDDSTSSSSSSSSSESRPSDKRNKKHLSSSKERTSTKSKPKDDYDKIKSARAKASRLHSPSPVGSKFGKKGKDRRERNPSPPTPKSKQAQQRSSSSGKSNLNNRGRGPRTPSPPTSRKQRQWAQSSSADSRSADAHRSRGKRHKRKRDSQRIDKFKTDRGPTPPPLSSPNRTALLGTIPSKKSKREDSSGLKSRHRGRDSSPLLLPRNSSSNSQVRLLSSSHSYASDQEKGDKHRIDDRPKAYSRKEDDLLPRFKSSDGHDRNNKRSKLSPHKDNRKCSISPQKDRYDVETFQGVTRKLYSPLLHGNKEEKLDHRRSSLTPPRSVIDRRKSNEGDKKRDIRDLSPRSHDNRREQYRNIDSYGYDKKSGDSKGKKLLSPDIKKSRDERNRDRKLKDRNEEYDQDSWSSDHRKSSALSTGRRTPEPRGRQELRSQAPLSSNDRSRERDSDRKKRKERDICSRSVDEPERSRLASPRRSPSPLHGHLPVREIEPLTGNRGHIYDPEIPPDEREYAYAYDPLHDPYINERLLPPDYEQDVLRGPLYPPDVYPAEPRYRRDPTLKEPVPIIDRYDSRDVISPRDVMRHSDVISLTARADDYLPDLPIDERVYDERWSRSRGIRDEWDPYGALPPAPLPPHMAADEDRYGMPRRRRASPDWQRGRPDDREPPLSSSHRQSGRGHIPPRENRSRSPPSSKGTGTNRSSWPERNSRHDSRNADRHDDSLKNQDDRKSRNIRKDRPKRKDDPINDGKPSNKEKSINKRGHSPSPLKDNKRKKDDHLASDVSQGSEKGGLLSSKKMIDFKNLPLNRNLKSIKTEASSPKSDKSYSSRISNQDKPESNKNANEVKIKEKDEKKSKHERVHGDNDFSDWSDDDDELLNRDDFELESTAENGRSKHRGNERRNEEGSSRHRDRSRDITDLRQKLKEKESHSRTNSKDRLNDEIHSSKDGKSPLTLKGTDSQEAFVLKDDNATDVDEYITAESVDYDPISEDELDALIEEPDDTVVVPNTENGKSKIVDALDVDWSALINETKIEYVPGLARKRFTAAHVLSRIGFSQALAGRELSEKIIQTCQKQLEEEEPKEKKSEETKMEENKKKEKKFVMEHQIAAFHVAISQNKKERTDIFNQVGPYRRALCARRDLQIRKLLCKPINKLTLSAPITYSPQYSVVDKELYKQSLELLKSNDHQPKTVDVCS